MRKKGGLNSWRKLARTKELSSCDDEYLATLSCSIFRWTRQSFYTSESRVRARFLVHKFPLGGTNGSILSKKSSHKNFCRKDDCDHRRINTRWLLDANIAIPQPDYETRHQRIRALFTRVICEKIAPRAYWRMPQPKFFKQR
jgi:hypothetical protein